MPVGFPRVTISSEITANLSVLLFTISSVNYYYTIQCTIIYYPVLRLNSMIKKVDRPFLQRHFEMVAD